MGSLKVSLVIPTHQREELLRELLESLQNQTLARDEFEVVVVVDGTGDPAWPILQGLSVPYRLRSFRHEQSGPSVTRNRGAHLAQGEVLVFLDDDMLPGEKFLEEHLHLHEAHHHAVILGAYVPPSMAMVKGHGGWNVWEARVLERHYREVENGKRPPAGRRLYSGNFSVRRDDFWRVGGFDESLERGEDIELGTRLEREGLTFRFGVGTAAVHRGFRNFESWCRSAYLYGQCDIQLGVAKGQGGIAEAAYSYQQQKALARWAVNLCVGRPPIYNLAISFLTSVSHQLTELGLYALAHYGYSGIYKLQYWRGFIERLGGKETLEKQVEAWRTEHVQGTAGSIGLYQAPTN